MDGRGGAAQEAKAGSNAGASAEHTRERPWLPRHLCIRHIIEQSFGVHGNVLTEWIEGCLSEERQYFCDSRNG